MMKCYRLSLHAETRKTSVNGKFLMQQFTLHSLLNHFVNVLCKMNYLISRAFKLTKITI